MRPAAFAYFRPDSLDEAIANLAEAGDEARVLAGGQSLIPAMNLRVARPSALIDIGRVPGLDVIRVDNGMVRIGARVTHRAIEDSGDLEKSLPVLPAMARHIAHQAVRNRGTFGGSLANADAASEWPCAMVALGGEMTAAGPRGERVIAAEDFFVTHFTTALETDEVLTGAALPALAANQRWAFREVARQPGAFALVMALARATVEADGTVSNVNLALGGCGERPVAPISDWSFLVGSQPTTKVLEAAAAEAAGAIDPHGDSNAGAGDRRRMAATLVRRVLADALDLDGGGA